MPIIRRMRVCLDPLALIMAPIFPGPTASANGPRSKDRGGGLDLCRSRAAGAAGGALA